MWPSLWQHGRSVDTCVATTLSKSLAPSPTLAWGQQCFRSWSFIYMSPLFFSHILMCYVSQPEKKNSLYHKNRYLTHSNKLTGQNVLYLTTGKHGHRVTLSIWSPWNCFTPEDSGRSRWKTIPVTAALSARVSTCWPLAFVLRQCSKGMDENLEEK